jgi:hypothetical protein
MKRLIAALFLVVLGGGILAPPANASGAFVRTEVTWTGAACIDVTLSDTSSTYTYTKGVCSGSYVLTESNVWPGDWIGVDPIMGSASYIECTMWIDGYLAWQDDAARGDGTDVNCLRIKS